MTTSAVRPYLPALVHFSVWAALGSMLLVLQPLSWDVALPSQFWIMQGVIFCAFVGLFYLNADVWAPRFLYRNKIGLFIFLALGSSLLVLMLLKNTRTWLELPELLYKVHHPDPADQLAAPKQEDWLSPAMIFYMGMILLILFISTSVAAMRKGRQETKARQELEKQKISSELSFLKAQINPHFFFNTLHNIYSLTMFNVESAREALHTLSRMMRYVLYETESDSIPLSKEVAFVQDYIDLMKLRLTDKIQVTFAPPVPLADVPIAPMLLLPFVENAFKFGASTTECGQIYIGIKQEVKYLEIELRNTLFAEKRAILEDSNGIGLVNTRRRLDLLYPQRYTLKVTERTPENEFLVHLVLEL